jgi:hypothetical protein
MKKIFSKLYIIQFIIVAFVITEAYAVTEDEARKAIKQIGGVEKFLKEISATLAKNAPQRLDSETTFISAFANGEKINLTHELFNISSKKEVKNSISAIIGNQEKKLCSSPVSSIAIKEFHASYHYLYLGKNGTYLFDFDVDEKSCKRLSN